MRRLAKFPSGVKGGVVMESATSLPNDHRQNPSQEPGQSRRAFFTRTALAGLGASGLLASPYHQAGAALSTATTNCGEETDLRQRVVNVRDFGAKGDGVTNDTPKIQKAIDSLPGRGGTVFFPAGTYLLYEAVNGRCLLLRSNTDYVGEGPVTKFLLAPLQGASARMMTTIGSPTSRDIIIRRLHFDGNRARQDSTVNIEQQHAIFLAGVEDCRVEGCLFHDTGGDAVYAFPGSGGLTPSQRVVVENNEMYALNRVGVNFAGTSNSIARGNFIHDTDNNALKMEQDAGNVPVSGNKFIRNLVCRAGGLALSSTGDRRNLSDILIEDNAFSITTSEAISLAEVSEIEITRNNIWQPPGAAITLRSSQDIMIKSNSIRDAVSTGPGNSAIIVFSEIFGGTLPYSQRIRIENNVMSDNAMSGCTIRHSDDAVIKDNFILNNHVVINGIGQAYAIDMRLSNNTTVRGNTIKGNDYAIAVYGKAAYNRFLENKVLANSSGIEVTGDAGKGNEFGTLGKWGSNCIQGNTAFGLKTAIPVNAIGNFWGCAAGPGNPGCDTVLGPASIIPVLPKCVS
jgi:parallel beta-helix repeat protein